MLERFRNDLKRLVAVRSVRGEAEQNAPYGKGPKRALEIAADIIREHGYEPHITENAAVWFDFCSGETELGILAHLDVVEEGSGWDSDPFTLSERDGCFYGRGTSDDKGPALCVLYALDKLKSEGVQLKKNVRVYFGSDEECGSDDIRRLFTHEKPPKYLFSPDAQYPVVNTEKGRLHADISDERLLTCVTEIGAGSALNIVPSKAYAVCRGIRRHDIKTIIADTESVCGISFETAPLADGIKITAHGESAHASEPHKGNNAATALLRLLSKIPMADREIFCRLSGFFPHGVTDGSAQSVDCDDGLSGALTLSPDIISCRGGRVTVSCDIRVPVKSEGTAGRLQECAAVHGLRMDITSEVSGHHVEETSPFVKALLEAYELHSGRRGECVSTGGGTYVHDMEQYGCQGVAFGACLPETDTNMHGANEFAVIDELMMSVDIFAEAIKRICG